MTDRPPPERPKSSTDLRTIREWRQELDQAGARVFLAAYGSPFLLLPDVDLDEAGEESGFKTRIGDGRSMKDLIEERLAQPSRDDDHRVAALVQKRAGGTFSGHIGVGRARNVDVCLPLPQLSKYHAYFLLEDGGYSLVDAGSTNGTRVGGEVLQPREARKLGEREVLRLGPYRLEYFTAEEFVSEVLP